MNNAKGFQGARQPTVAHLDKSMWRCLCSKVAKIKQKHRASRLYWELLSPNSPNSFVAFIPPLGMKYLSAQPEQTDVLQARARGHGKSRTWSRVWCRINKNCGRSHRVSWPPKSAGLPHLSFGLCVHICVFTFSYLYGQGG